MSRPLSSKSQTGALKDLHINPKVSLYQTNGSGRVNSKIKLGCLYKNK
jgi:hypothetical protein